MPQLKWLITGASGFIGHQLAEALNPRHEVLGTFHSTAPSQAPFPFLPLDILDEYQVISVMNQHRPDIVVHLAGAKDVNWCEDSPVQAEQLNSIGTKNIAEGCLKTGAFLVFISSDYVFSGMEGDYGPSCECRPVTVYGQTKLRAERFLLAMSSPAAIVRTSGVYSANNPEQTFLGTSFLHLKRGEEIDAYENIFNSPTYIGDLINAIETIGMESMSGIFHLAGASRESRYSFLRFFAKEFGFPIDLVKPAQYHPEDERVQRPLDISLNSRSSFAVLNIRNADAATGLRLAREHHLPRRRF